MGRHPEPTAQGSLQSLPMRRHARSPELVSSQSTLHSLAYLHNYVYIAGMQLSWDEAKRQVHLRQHGLDNADAAAIFAGTTFTCEDDCVDGGEPRWITLGLLHGRVVIITSTEHHDEIRMMSMREGTTLEHLLSFRCFTGECRTP